MTTIELLTEKDDKTGKCRFFINWIDRETGKQRSQVFYAKPEEYSYATQG